MAEKKWEGTTYGNGLMHRWLIRLLRIIDKKREAIDKYLVGRLRISRNYGSAQYLCRTDPKDWWYEPELSGMLKTMTTNPGEIGLHMAEDLMDVDIDADSLKHIIDFFSYDKEFLKGKTIYYADKHYSESHPIFMLDGKYVCSINKFFNSYWT